MEKERFEAPELKETNSYLEDNELYNTIRVLDFPFTLI